MVKGKIRLIGCGGAGINVVANLEEPLSQLGYGFSDIETMYVDTSLANAKRYGFHDQPSFKLIKSIDVGIELEGAGGERRENVKHLVEAAKNIVNENNMKDEPHVFNVIVFSASGGTGSVIGPLLAGAMLEKNITTSTIVIGDTDCILYAINTNRTLKSLDSIVRLANKSMCVYYVNNSEMEANSVEKRKEEADKSIFNILAVYSLFCSGHLTDIDSKDMKNFFSPHAYKTVDIPKGLLSVAAYESGFHFDSSIEPMILRVAFTDGQSTDTDGVMFRNKKEGYVEGFDDNKIYNDKSFPIFLLSYSNWFSFVQANLEKIIGENNKVLERDSIDYLSNGDNIDDNGLVV